MNILRRLFSLNRIAGVLLVVFSAASLAATTYALYASGSLVSQVTSELTGAASAASGLLDTSLLALQATANGLKDTQAILKTIDQAFLTLDDAIAKSFGLLTSTTELTGETLPETLAATQRSLTTAQETAASIEAVLGVVSQVPFFPGGPYKPEVSLEEALGDVSSDLEQLKPALEAMSQTLKTTQSNMREVRADIIDIVIQLRSTQEHLSGAEDVVAEYQAQVLSMEDDLAAFSAVIPARVEAAAWFVRFILLWIGIGQGALLLYGIKLIR